ncbi:hypothetical protein D3C71_389440 [compost metagenome]
MKLKSTFPFLSKKKKVEIHNDAYYDQFVDFYFSNLINSLILFSLSKEDLEKLIAIAFDPIFELESEIDYAFLPVCFETVFRNGKLSQSVKQDLVDFKLKTDAIPREVWDWEYLETHGSWISIRTEANLLLDKIGITHRTYGDDYTTVYDVDGNILQQGKPTHNQ